MYSREEVRVLQVTQGDFDRLLHKPANLELEDIRIDVGNTTMISHAEHTSVKGMYR